MTTGLSAKAKELLLDIKEIYACNDCDYSSLHLYRRHYYKVKKKNRIIAQNRVTIIEDDLTSLIDEVDELLEAYNDIIKYYTHIENKNIYTLTITLKD